MTEINNREAIDAIVRRAVAVHQRDLSRTPAARRRRRAVRGTWRVSRALARHSFARRRPLAPIVTSVLLYLAGVIFAVSPHGANTVALFTAPIGLVVWWRARRRQWRPVERYYAAAVLVAGYGWVQATAIVGPWAPMPGVLLVGALAAALPWWWHHRIRPSVPDNDERLEVWAERVAAPGGALPGSRLRHVSDAGNGWAATIALPPGKLTTDSALSARARIASAYGLATTSVVIEPPSTGEAHLARLCVLHHNPLQQVQLFRGPGLDHSTGAFPIGPYHDGEMAYWRLWDPGSGACHGLIAGTTGGGKSVFVNLLCTEIRHSGVVVLWLGDPEGGVSVPDWQDAADWFAAEVPEIRRMLQATERVMIGRKRRRARREWVDAQGRTRYGLAAFEPSPAEPQLTVVIDESPDVMNDPESVRIIQLIAKKGRKLGVSVVPIAQVPSVAELGGNITIRSMVSSMNIVMFRTSDRLSGKMGMPKDLVVDPVNLPTQWPDGSSTAGLGYVATAGGRVSEMRSLYIADPYYWANCPAPAVTLEPAAAEDAGEDYRSWRERRDGDVDDPDLRPDERPVLVPIDDDPEPTTKAAILAQLQARGQVRTGTLAELVDAPLPTVSSTLRRLEQEGLALQVRHGEWARTEDGPRPPSLVRSGWSR
jgi:DNA-binding transcriptional ArsR family regulator